VELLHCWHGHTFVFALAKTSNALCSSPSSGRVYSHPPQLPTPSLRLGIYLPTGLAPNGRKITSMGFNKERWVHRTNTAQSLPAAGRSVRAGRPQGKGFGPPHCLLESCGRQGVASAEGGAQAGDGSESAAFPTADHEKLKHGERQLSFWKYAVEVPGRRSPCRSAARSLRRRIPVTLKDRGDPVHAGSPARGLFRWRRQKRGAYIQNQCIRCRGTATGAVVQSRRF
jgi:hypothetical protein